MKMFLAMLFVAQLLPARSWLDLIEFSEPLFSVWFPYLEADMSLVRIKSVEVGSFVILEGRKPMSLLDEKLCISGQNFTEMGCVHWMTGSGLKLTFAADISCRIKATTQGNALHLQCQQKEKFNMSTENNFIID